MTEPVRYHVNDFPPRDIAGRALSAVQLAVIHVAFEAQPPFERQRALRLC